MLTYCQVPKMSRHTTLLRAQFVNQLHRSLPPPCLEYDSSQSQCHCNDAVMKWLDQGSWSSKGLQFEKRRRRLWPKEEHSTSWLLVVSRCLIIWCFCCCHLEWCWPGNNKQRMAGPGLESCREFIPFPILVVRFRVSHFEF